MEERDTGRQLCTGEAAGTRWTGKPGPSWSCWSLSWVVGVKRCSDASLLGDHEHTPKEGPPRAVWRDRKAPEQRTIRQEEDEDLGPLSRFEEVL